MKAVEHKIRQLAPPAILILAIILLWELCSIWFKVPEYLLPRPTRILEVSWVKRVTLWGHLRVTMEEVLLGFLVGFVVGYGLALVMFFSVTLRRALNPIVVISQTVPVIALGPILVIWLGYNIWPKIIIVALIVFFPLTVNAFDGLISCDPDLITLLRSMGARRWQIFTKVQQPNAMPFITSASKVAITFSVIGAVVAEWIGSDRGLGAYILQTNAQIRTPEMFSAIFITSILGIVMFFIAQGIENLIIPWQKGGRVKRKILSFHNIAQQFKSLLQRRTKGVSQ
jgi:ABC-type nitrate/sulfonate/bicarbonate transport system permease component